MQPPIIMICFSIKTLFNTRNDSQKLRRGSLDSRSYIYKDILDAHKENKEHLILAKTLRKPWLS